jgi:hypothetical protein
MIFLEVGPGIEVFTFGPAGSPGIREGLGAADRFTLVATVAKGRTFTRLRVDCRKRESIINLIY